MGAVWCCGGGEVSGEHTSAEIENIEERIFSLMMESFCTESAECALFGQMVKDESMAKLSAKIKKLQETLADLERRDPCDVFISRAAMVDPVEGEVIIPHERIMSILAKCDVDQLYCLYEGLRNVKVEKLRDTHGADIVAIMDADGTVQDSECGGRKGRDLMRQRRAAQEQAAAGGAAGDASGDVRSLGLS